MGLDPVPSFATPLFSSEAQPLLVLDGLYPQEPMIKGAAVSFSLDASKPLDIYNTGNGLAGEETIGVINSTPRAPSLQSMGPGYEETLQVVLAGRCSVLLAPGLTVTKGHYLEPIGSASPGLWREVTGLGRGHFQALESVDNSGGSQPLFVSGVLFPKKPGSGLLGLIKAPSTPLTGLTEQAFDASLLIPKNILSAGKKLRISALVDFVKGNPGDKTVLACYLGGLLGLQLAQSNPSGTAFVTGDQGIMELELDVLAVGLAGKILSFGQAAIGTLGSASFVLVGKAGPQTLDTTVDQALVISNQFSSANPDNQAVLRALSVELA